MDRGRAVLGGLIFSFVAIGVAACVSDDSSTNDAGSDSAAPQDAQSSDTASEAAPGDAGIDAADATTCSSPLVGSTVTLPSGTFNSTTVEQSAPLLAGDYELTGTNVFSPCNFNCPGVHSGTLFGGIRLTSTGASTFLLERHLEMLQGATKTVVVDAFDATFDQLAETLTVTKICNQDGGAPTDAGSPWSTIVLIGSDGGASGVVLVEFQDFPVALSFADGGAGGSGKLYATLTKQ